MTEISLHKYCEQIENTIEQGLYAETIAHGKHILKQYPKHVTTYQLLGKAMLEAGQNEHAADMFRRVLSADPEDMVAWVGMSEVYHQRDELDAATWFLERAFELVTDNEIVEEELRHLYGRPDGIEPQRVQLTRGALARLYLKGDLLSRAINEFRALLAEHPERVDLSVALAEALWRNEQRLEASEVCQRVLDVLPYCLKANLLLGEIWTSSGREEGQMYLRRAEAADPENHMAQELFGAVSPLLAREVQIVPLEREPATDEERPAWMAEIEAASAKDLPLTEGEGEAALVGVTAVLEAQIEIPTWLEEIATSGPTEPSEKQPPEETVLPPTAEAPEWLTGLGPEPIGDEEAAPSVPPAEQPPDWLAGLREQFTEEVKAPEEALTPAAEEVATPALAEVPDWLQEIAPSEAAPAEAVFPPAEEAVAPPVEEAFDWTASGEPEAPPEAIAAVEKAPPVEEATPAWLEEEGVPSGDEALAWLEQLAAGKEEELRTQAQAEAETRMAEIMGRAVPTQPPPVEAAPEEPAPAIPTPAPAEIPDWLQEMAPSEAAPAEAAFPPAEEAITPPVEEAFGWTAFGEPEAPPEAIAAVEEVPPEKVTAPLVEEAVAAVKKAPPVEEAAPPRMPEPAYLEEVQAPPMVEFPAVEEIPSPEEIPAAEMAPPTEEVRWGAVLEVPPEEKEAEVVAPVPVVEEIPGVVEMEIVEPFEFEEITAPPEVAIVEAPAEPFAAERAHLKEHPRDYETWLTLARALWQAGERQEALKTYTRVIRAGKLLASVIADLEEYVEQWPDTSTQRALGDAYMKHGRLQEALDIYRRALDTL